MTKTEHVEIARAQALAPLVPDLAARMLATVHRATRSPDTRDLVAALVQQLDLTQYLTVRNGCLTER